MDRCQLAGVSGPAQIHEIALIGEALGIKDKYWTIIAVTKG